MTFAPPELHTAPAGSWQPDPWGRHQYRWFDGHAWTASVSSDGVQSTDADVLTPTPPPPPPTPPAPPAPPAPTVSPLPILSKTPRPGGVHRLAPGFRGPAGKAPLSRSRKLARVTLVVVLFLLAAVVAIAVFVPDPKDSTAVTSPTVVPLLLGSGATHREQQVSASTFGDEWPLTVGAGTLVCEAVPAPMEVQSVFFVDPAGTVYAVNGTARGTITTHGWNDVESIWTPDPTNADLKVNIGPLIAAGLEICDPAPITDDPVDPDLAGAAVAAMWAASTPEQQATYCNAWNVAPDMAREAFLAGSDKAADFWPALEQILRDSC